MDTVKTKEKPKITREDIEYGIGQSSLGKVLIAYSKDGLCALLIDDDQKLLRRSLETRFKNARLLRNDENKIQANMNAVLAYIDNPAEKFETLQQKLDLRGTEFQRRVWQELLAIPKGKTTSYAAIAEKMGAPTSVRAVANACGANNVAVIVPCHRVVGSNGSMTGYRWGIERKRALLDKESAQ